MARKVMIFFFSPCQEVVADPIATPPGYGPEMLALLPKFYQGPCTIIVQARCLILAKICITAAPLTFNNGLTAGAHCGALNSEAKNRLGALKLPHQVVSRPVLDIDTQTIFFST